MDLSECQVSSDFFELFLRDGRDPGPLPVDDRQRDVLVEVGHPRKDRPLGPPEAGHHGVESGLTPGNQAHMLDNDVGGWLLGFWR